MNKYIIGIIAIVVIAAGAALFFTQKSEAPVQTAQEETSQAAPGAEQASQTAGGKKTMKELFAGNTEQTCTFSSQADGAQTSGTVYIKGGGADMASLKMRGDFDMTADGKTTKSHMIVDGQTSYIWTDDMKQGFKMSFANVETQSGQTSQGPDINEAYDYKCTPNVASESVFALPAGVTFGELPSFSAGASGAAGASGNAQQCAACAQISDPSAQAQCKAALKCS